MHVFRLNSGEGCIAIAAKHCISEGGPVFLLKQIKLVAIYLMAFTTEGVEQLHVNINAPQFLATLAFFLAQAGSFFP